MGAIRVMCRRHGSHPRASLRLHWQPMQCQSIQLEQSQMLLLAQYLCRRHTHFSRYQSDQYIAWMAIHARMRLGQHASAIVALFKLLMLLMVMFDARAANEGTGRHLIDGAVNGVNLVHFRQLELRACHVHRDSSQMQTLERISARDAVVICTARAEEIATRVQQVRLPTMLARIVCVQQARTTPQYTEQFNALTKISSKTLREKSQPVYRAII